MVSQEYIDEFFDDRSLYFYQVFQLKVDAVHCFTNASNEATFSSLGCRYSDMDDGGKTLNAQPLNTELVFAVATEKFWDC